MSSKKQREHELKMCEWASNKFKQAYVAKAPLMEKWKKYEKAYHGDLFTNYNKPDYKANQITNLVFSTIESIRPIMVDNNPKFVAIPNTPEGEGVCGDVQTALDYEWNREEMDVKLPAQLLPLLIYGTCVFFLPWDAKKNNVSCKPVNPFNIFPDPLAETIDDAEYVIYATYKHANELKKMFPQKADKFVGGNINHSELVHERDKDAVGSQDQILTLEIWFRDWTSMEEVEDVDGEKKKKFKYPNGRVLTCCPDIGVVLSDKKNPYKDGKFPFLIIKDYDIPFEFWGRGEVEQILSPQMYANELTNQIIDNAKSTANMPWIVDKNCGISPGKLTNRPGLVIRKNPGTEVRRDNPPTMPMYVRDTIDVFKKDIQDVSGVFDSLKGEKQTGVVAAQAIMALQEASQARIRLKIKQMEHHLGKLATMWYSRMQQFWKTDRWVRITDIENNVEFTEITAQTLENDFDIRISAGSTMPTNKNAMLDLMIRLAQTTAEDGMPMVDRKAVIDLLPTVDKRAIIKRMEEYKQEQQSKQDEQAQIQQQIQQAQQIGEQEKATIQETLQGLSNTLKTVSQQVDELQIKQYKIEEKEREQNIEDKGYNRGLKDGQKNISDVEKPNEEPIPQEGGIEPTENYMSEEEINEMISPEALDSNEEVNTGQIPAEVLQEMAQMSEEELMQLFQEYPEIYEMYQQDKQTLGGMLND